MTNCLKTQNFIEKADKKHYNKYCYKYVVYVKAIEKVIIVCNIHGEFKQTPNYHLNGGGCKKCNIRKTKWDKDFFIEECLRRNNGYLPFTIIGEYKGTTENILVENKYGICSIRANHILNGVIPGIETAIDKASYWKKQAILNHGSLYDYSKVNYINSNTKITITCKVHGEFLQTPNSHLSGKGCGKCTKKQGGLKRSEKYSNKFRIEANKTHSGKYSYYEDIIFKAKDVISIICPLHGDFLQVADNHLRGDGCQKCGLKLLIERMRENPIGWSYTNWQKAGERSKNFDSYKVYIIKCWDDNEEFYKIGKTFSTIKKRFKNKNSLPYKYKIIKEVIFESAKEASEVEHILKNCNKYNKYIPLNNFNGLHECFRILDLSCFENNNITIIE